MARGLPLFAPTGVVKISEAFTVDVASATETLEDQIDGASEVQTLTTIVKDVTGTISTKDITIINALGVNQYIMIEKPELSELAFTMINPIDIANGVSPYEWLLGASSSHTVSGNIFYTVTGGEKLSGDRTKKAVLFKNTQLISSNTAIQTLLLNNAYVTDIERSLDAEGHEELTVTVKALSEDTFIEFDGADAS